MNPPPVQAAQCARKAGPSSCPQQLALCRRRGVGGAGQSARALLEFSGNGNGGASHFSSSFTRPYRCLGTVSGERHRWENPPDSSSQDLSWRGWGIGRGQVQVLTLVSGTEGKEREKVCRGMSNLESPQEKWLQGDSGHR